MARVGPGRARGSRRGRGQRRPPTWEISDSDAEGPAGSEADSEAAARARAPAEERGAAQALRLLRPEQAVRRLVVRVDPAILEDAGADILMEALGTLGCEYQVEPQCPARSLRWCRVKPDPCPRSPCPWMSPQVPPEVWAADEQDLLLLLEPEEFLQGVVQLTQICGPTCSVPWVPPESHACPHLAVIGLDAYLWQHRESQAFSFCVAGRWAAGEQVARDGTGLRGAWRRQITQFNRVSPAVAEAVVSAFPSPRLLQQAYAACSTEQERLALLADLPVEAGEGVRPRRVGPDLSRRIYLFLTTTDPDLLLDLGS
ncbi:probable crossover junction endonuclease EME2 isoform X3 [Equus quagga]|uniref:probable crossover junction endonuclease EME2 isoform X3 n=1 Tax=Equus quagga TaxID=89248 RepID=UPI001EE23AB5|nr:probable crossover junction endonuclease EME2 isoform X3 [Equus quagga]